MKTIVGPTRDRDPRYWRHRGNRQVRKARVTRTLLRWSVILLTHGVIAGVLLYSGSRILSHLAKSPELAVKRIEVSGCSRASADQIEADLARFIGQPVLSLPLAHVEQLAARDPWVRKAHVKRRLPSGVRVVIEERRPVALAVIGGVVHVIDETGYVIGPAGLAMSDDLPVLTGLAEDGRDELVADLQRGADMVRRLEDADPLFVDRMSEMNLAATDRLQVRTVSRGPTLLLDPMIVERNVHRYVGLREEIERRVGGTRYVDLRWRDRILVMPEELTQ
ncbi:MAG: FtsQ-type POTRA domain-containing protein [bacterium]|nr:FtsQ-type POTRA domain-containing protein [bacterium]